MSAGRLELMDIVAFFSQLHWAVIGQIIVIDILLGGDNAVVIALACRNLNPKQRWKAIIWGTAGAIALRVILVAFAVTLLKLPALKIIGGLLLIWIGIRLMLPDEGEAHGEIEGASNLWGAVKTIIVADVVMSLDNVIAIAGAADQSADAHQIYYVVFGLIVSIPIIIFGSQLVLKLMDRFPAIVTLGAGLLGYIAGDLVISDPLTQPWTSTWPQSVHLAVAIAGAALVIGVGQFIIRRHRLARDVT